MKDVYDDILRLLEKIRENEKLVIVEGFKDKKALEGFGIERIKVLKGRALYKVIEEVEDKEVVILTDLDSAGKKIYAILKDKFSQRGIKVDDVLREFLFRKTTLREIEGLKRFMEKMG